MTMNWNQLVDPYVQSCEDATEASLAMIQQWSDFMAGCSLPLEWSKQYGAQCREAFEQALDETWHHWGLPSRREVANVLKRIHALEECLTNLPDRQGVEELGAAISKNTQGHASKHAKSLQTSLSRLEKRLIETIEKQNRQEAAEKGQPLLKDLTAAMGRLTKLVNQANDKLNALNFQGAQPDQPQSEKTGVDPADEAV